VTGEHPFYVANRGWLKVKQLKKGDLFKSKKAEIRETITSIKLIQRKTQVFNIEVDKNHNYFITNSAILVHNKQVPTPSNNPKN
jgi:intein/homing endonuclease